MKLVNEYGEAIPDADGIYNDYQNLVIALGKYLTSQDKFAKNNWYKFSMQFKQNDNGTFDIADINSFKYVIRKE